MPLVGESEWIMAEFTIGGVAMDSAVKGVTTGLRDLGGGCCKLGTTCGVDANVMLVRVLISEDTVVTTFELRVNRLAFVTLFALLVLQSGNSLVKTSANFFCFT